MARIYREIDTLKRLLVNLKRAGLGDFKSIEEILQHQSLCLAEVKKTQMKVAEEYNQALLNQSRYCIDLTNEYEEKYQKIKLEQEERISLLVQRLTQVRTLSPIQKTWIKLHLVTLKHYFRFSINRQLRGLTRSIARETKKLEQAKTSKASIIHQNTKEISKEFYLGLEAITQNESLLTGAIGEQKALDELSKLSNDYIVINDFNHTLSKPIYNRRTRQRIFSIQADHIVIGPTGVFLIETKNWSSGTANQQVQFSPIEQIKRTNFALFCLLNPRRKFSWLLSLVRKTPPKISIKSILLMTNHSTSLRDTYVRVLGLQEITSYINQSQRSLETDDIESIFKKLIR